MSHGNFHLFQPYAGRESLALLKMQQETKID
jgi:hypothetical protein